ncbi:MULTISPECIES: 50S ribosomal protein bL37 [unclassified Streptomyces]
MESWATGVQDASCRPASEGGPMSSKRRRKKKARRKHAANHGKRPQS